MPLIKEFTLPGSRHDGKLLINIINTAITCACHVTLHSVTIGSLSPSKLGETPAELRLDCVFQRYDENITQAVFVKYWEKFRCLD